MGSDINPLDPAGIFDGGSSGGFEAIFNPMAMFTEGGFAAPFGSDFMGSGSHSVGKPNQDLMSEATRAQTESARSMEQIAGELWGAGRELRPQLQGSYENLLAGGLTGQDSPLYQAIQPHASAQYDVAAQNLAGAGGGDAMNLISEAQTEGLSDLMAKSAMDDYSKLFGVAFGQPGTALQGHYGAGSIWGQAGGQLAQQQQIFNQQMGDLGSSLGEMFA